MANRPVEPLPVVELVEAYLSKTLSDAEQYVNSSPLDESGIYSLHILAGEIYQLGFADGEASAERRAYAHTDRAGDAMRQQLAGHTTDKEHGNATADED